MTAFIVGMVVGIVGAAAAAAAYVFKKWPW